MRGLFRLERAPSLKVGNNPGCFGCHCSFSSVSLLDAGRSTATKCASQPKWWAAPLGRLADNRHVPAAADHASDVLEGHALVANGVVARSSGTLLQYEPVKMSSIEPVHRGPAVETVTHVC